MYLVVTDCGSFWNHNNPVLKKYKSSVIVVCLRGKPVTDEYKCFVSTYKGEYEIKGRGHTPPQERQEYTDLAENADELIDMFGYHNDVVFLTDYSVESLFPYWAVIDKKSYNRYHLCAFPDTPEFLAKERFIRKTSDGFKNLRSIMMLDESVIRNYENREQNVFQGFLEYLQKYYEKLFPRMLNGINDMTEKSYFDFKLMKYIPISEGYNEIAKSKPKKLEDKLNFDASPLYHTLGRVGMSNYPSEDEWDKEYAEQLLPRLDGKDVCNYLRKMRIALAAANGIDFEGEECPSVGPCAGTCAKCDSEAEYLRREMSKIPEEKRVYPQFDVKENKQ